jgi:hypothetical protein
MRMSMSAKPSQAAGSPGELPALLKSERLRTNRPDAAASQRGAEDDSGGKLQCLFELRLLVGEIRCRGSSKEPLQFSRGLVL